LSLAFALFSAAALTQGHAQPAAPALLTPPETLYSEAQRQKDMSAGRGIVDNLLRQSFSLDGEYARWTQPVCPHVYGLTPLAAWQIEHRIKQVTRMVGAPLNNADPCIPNNGIVFTAEPQTTLMSIAGKVPLLVQCGNQTADGAVSGAGLVCDLHAHQQWPAHHRHFVGDGDAPLGWASTHYYR